MVDLFQALAEGKTDWFEARLAEDPSLASSRNEQGVPLLLVALYHRQTELAEQVAEYLPALDLLEAAALGRLPRIDVLLAEGAHPAMRSADGFTPLHYSVFFGRSEAADRLLAAGAEVDVPADNPSRVTPLHSAVASQCVDGVRSLLAAGATVDSRQSGGFTPLMSAAGAGHEALVDLLLGAGAQPSLPSDDGRTAADLAEERGHPDLAIRLRGL